MLPDNNSPMTLQKILLIAGSILVGIFVWVYISSPLVVTVTGKGEVTVPATSATVSFSLSAIDSSPQTALASVKSRADGVRNMLTSRGIAQEDIVEGQITTLPASLSNPGAQGFQSTLSMAAKTEQVAEISSLVSDIYSSGASVVSQPIISLDNQDEYEKQALDDAIAEAKKEAGQMAVRNLKLFRKIVSINQNTSPTTSTATTKPDALTEANSAVAAANGVFKIVKSVSLVYKMW